MKKNERKGKKINSHTSLIHKKKKTIQAICNIDISITFAKKNTDKHTWKKFQIQIAN